MMWIPPPQAQLIPALLGESLLTPESPELWAQPTGTFSPLCLPSFTSKTLFSQGTKAQSVGVSLSQKDIYQPGPMWDPKNAD